MLKKWLWKLTGLSCIIFYYRKWLVALLSLAVIMGLTWVLGLAVVQVKELLGLAYIQTILMAFQGLFIFLIFVVFPKKVRKEYIKWWRAKVKKSPMLQKCFGGSKNLSSSSTSKRAVRTERARYRICEGYKLKSKCLHNKFCLKFAHYLMCM